MKPFDGNYIIDSLRGESWASSAIKSNLCHNVPILLIKWQFTVVLLVKKHFLRNEWFNILYLNILSLMASTGKLFQFDFNF